MLMAGAAIGAGAVITQNAMADDGSSQPADTLTMVNIDADGNSIACTFTGEDVVGLVPAGIPTDNDAKAEAVISGSGVIGSTGVITSASGDLPEVSITDVAGSLPLGATQGVVTVQASANGTAGVVSIDGAVGEARDGTPEECQAMRDQAMADLQNLQGQVVEAGGSLVVSGSAGVTVSTKP